MGIVDVDLIEESQSRYITYALSVVSSRALPDVRDGLKPVQRRILYAMYNQLNLTPDRYHRKSAAVVGEVLARFHPHGDAACYEAMVRMAQDFSLRYPLIDGQGNFGSLDGDAAAAYRYTEARLTALAMEVIGDIDSETVKERDNFDQTIKEPVVLPARVPNLLINGASGIAVGMATSIPPHNLKEVVKAVLMLLDDEEVKDTKLLTAIKGPDFPTSCLIMNSAQELREIYKTGRGAVRMRAAYQLESGNRGKEFVVVTSIPYGVDKSDLVSKIADFIIAKKVPQLVDIRDESTDEVRIVLELSSGADSEKAMAYLFKNSALQQNFNVNLTALVPSQNPLVSRPAQLSLREMLFQFIGFRLEVTRNKLLFEKNKLDQRIHLLEGLIKIFNATDEVIKIVRSSEGRADAARNLQERFKLSEVQALFIVDLRIYQLSKTSIDEIKIELNEKISRVSQIKKILASEKALKEEIAKDLERLVQQFGDNRRSEIVGEYKEVEFNKEEYIQHEQVYVCVSKDGWIKRIRATNDPSGTRVREGDKLSYVAKADTRDFLVVFSTLGNVYTGSVFELSATSGFGDPVQKLFKFDDGEQISHCLVMTKEQLESRENSKKELLVYTARGYGFRFSLDQITQTKKAGKRVIRVAEGDIVSGVAEVVNDIILLVSADGYVTTAMLSEIPNLSLGAKGVILQEIPDDDRLVVVAAVGKKQVVRIQLVQGSEREIDIGALNIMGRAKRGLKLIKRGGPVLGIDREVKQISGNAVQGELF